MTVVSDGPAFAALRAALVGERGLDDFTVADPAGERLRQALADPSASALDLAVLLRQLLLLETSRSPLERPARCRRPTVRILDPASLRAAGLESPDGSHLWAAPWRPPWLADPEPEPDAVAAAAARRRFGAADQGPSPDPFVRPLGYARYRSVGQRAAVRAALLTPAGGALAIDLPTGEGKSLVFRAIDRVGFASGRTSGGEGVTLVVVPTVALGYDHENACRRDPDEILAYVGQDAARRAAIRERLTVLKSGLVFAAPEAACGSLRSDLVDLAQAGRLKALVLDEAHLVDAWGTGFRPEFQSLSGLRHELMAAAPPDLALRTILLSATLTPETLDTLETLFAAPDRLRLLSAAQTRPEPAYYVAPVADEPTREATVEAALLHAPRPAVLYVTKVADAVRWAARIREMGFRRCAAFHGKSPDAEREKTLAAWRGGELDLVVATSAFGLGIDYPHVRSVIHACVPETFDRFYQEVGRGGRDGGACLSLIAPTVADVRVARGLNRERVITVVRGLQRWSAMFHHPDSRHLGGQRVRVRLDVAPGPDEADIDLVGERSLQWNARILTLMSRAGLVRLVGDVASGPDEPGVYETIEVLEPGHLKAEIWTRFVEPVRAAIAAARTRNLNLMLQHLRGNICPSALLESLYGADRLLAGCSSCRLCRVDPHAARPDPLRREPASPWDAPPCWPPLADLIEDGELVVTYAPGASGGYSLRRAASALAEIWGGGVRMLRMPGEPQPLFSRALEALETLPIFTSVAASRATSRLPRGAEVLLVAPGGSVRLGEPRRDARVVLLPEDFPDPDRPGEALLERYNGRVISLDALLERLGT
ncbi:protein DpdF [Phenylobacterium sp.]|uniref:protein DpdF n=1 Tax=Phenylobacterium sp. TaxID=1871053 RepID=UPI003568A1A4